MRWHRKSRSISHKLENRPEIAGILDTTALHEIGQLFHPPLLWAFKNQAKINDKIEQIVENNSIRLQSRQEREPQTLTAAVTRLQLDGASWKNYRFGDRAWQADAWRLYDITGQLRFVANWAGNSISRCDLYVAELNTDGSPGQRVQNQEIAALSKGPLGAGDNRSESLRLMGIDLFVAGEAFLIVEAEGAEDGSDLWWVVTSRQIKRTGDRITVVRSPLYGGGTMEYRDGVDLILRIWTPHPNDTAEPDSPTRSAIPDLRELEALRKREFAELDSRLSGAGLLALPDSLDLPRGDDDPIGATGFFAYLMRAFARSLRDRSSAEAMVPIMITGPADDIQKINHITFWSDLSEQIGTMREAALRSLAQSLDIPPEVLLGLGGTNHWSAWAISDEAVQTQIKPLLSRIAAALTIGYLHPALEAVGVENPQDYAYAFDTAPLTTRPNRIADAINLHDRTLLSDDAAREAGAWGDESAPDDAEKTRRMLEKLLLSSPDAVLGDSGLRAFLGLPLGGSGSTTPSGSEQDSPDVTDERSIPDEPAQGDGEPSESSPLSVIAEISARRALSLLGTRVVPHSRRPVGVPRYQLHVHHGPVLDDAKIVKALDGWNEFGDIVTSFGIDPLLFQSVINDYCTDLVRRGMAHDSQLLADMISSPSTIRRLVATDGGQHG